MVQTGVISGLTISIVTSGVQETHLTRDAGNWNTDGFIAGNKITIYNSQSSNKRTSKFIPHIIKTIKTMI